MARFKRSADPNKSLEFWLTQAGLALISGWKQEGMSHIQIAKEMGISKKALENWARDYDEFYKAVNFGTREVQYQIENALERAAKGGHTKETKVITIIKNGKVIETIKEDLTKEIQPDVRAIKLYLTNRDPSKWQKDKLSLLENDGEESHVQVVVHKAMDNCEDGSNCEG